MYHELNDVVWYFDTIMVPGHITVFLQILAVLSACILKLLADNFKILANHPL